MAKGAGSKAPASKPMAPGATLFKVARGSRLVMLTLAVTIGALIGIVAWQADAIWETIGFGAIPGASMVCAVVGTFLFRPRMIVVHWFRFLGLILLGFTSWGALAFYDAFEGALERSSLGGKFGADLIGSRDAVGILRLVALGIAGAALLSPQATIVGVRRGAGASIMGWRLGLEFTQMFATAVANFTNRTGTSNKSSTSRQANTNSPIPVDVGKVENSEPNEHVIPVILEDSIAEHDPVEIVSIPEESELAADEKESIPELDDPSGISASVSSYLGEVAGKWRLPAIEILDHAPAIGSSGVDDHSRARAIGEALGSYNIEAKVVEINPGPAVTQFGVEPGWARRFKDVRVKDENGKQLVDDLGRPVVRREEVSRTRVKVDAISNLDKDLALALAASSIRIEAPIPGKSLVGVEVPNAQFEFVSLRGLMESPAFTKMRSKTKLAVALGKGSGGGHEVSDLTKMPHILIAGATGSGKSVSINAILASLLMQATPQDLRLLLIDPKRVEMAAYNSLPHLLMPVITDVDKVVSALRWAIQEMEQRYKRFSAVGARNLESYNKNKRVVESLPYIVIAVDELADLMMAAPYDVEHSLTRLAQLGRATGIHLIVATQRPSVDVVTGLIKANFPTRMSFAVSSVVDSRTILDSGGAEKLLGKGDSLYLPQDAPKPKRVQGVFVSDREIERLIRAWNSQNAHNKPAHVEIEEAPLPPTPPTKGHEAEPAGVSRDPVLSELIAEEAGHDILYEQAKGLATKYSRLSPSLLQRRLKVGYNKAKNLVEMLEEEGLVDADD